MAHRFTVEPLDHTLRDLMASNEPFGGKNVIFAGDFRQIPPVVPFGTRQEIINSSITIKSSTIWKTLKIHNLKIL